MPKPSCPEGYRRNFKGNCVPDKAKISHKGGTATKINGNGSVTPPTKVQLAFLKFFIAAGIAGFIFVMGMWITPLFVYIPLYYINHDAWVILMIVLAIAMFVGIMIGLSRA